MNFRGNALKAKSLGHIAKTIGGVLIPECAELLEIRKVSTDSRELSGGELFFALPALRDGHDFVDSAITRGAKAVVVSRRVQNVAPEIYVKNTLVALGELAKEYRTELAIPVIAITGSLGKTTTRMLLSHCLQAKYQVAQSKKNYNNLIGLPLSILDIEEHELAVLELGINLPGEMRRLAEIASPNYAVITNIAPVHIEGLGSLDKVAEEKLELLKHLPDEGVAFISADEPRLLGQDILPRERVRTFGRDTRADFRVENIRTLPDGRTIFDVNGISFRAKALGEGIAHATACAVAICTELGISPDEIVGRVAEFEGVPGRLTVHELDGIVFIEDYYNSSPLAVKQGLRALSAMAGARKVAVLGDMLELGRDEVRYHEEVGAFAGECRIDELYLFGELMANAVQPAISAGISQNNIFHTTNFEELISRLMNDLQGGDIVLVKASRSMKFERITTELEGACAARS